MILFCVVEPLRNGGSGCSVLEYNIIEQHSWRWSYVLVPLRWKRVNRKWNIYWVIPGERIRRFMGRYAFWPIYALAYLSGLIFKIRYQNLIKNECIFGFSGASWLFIAQLSGFSKGVGLPYVVYLVDDYEASLAPSCSFSLIDYIRGRELCMLKNARHVYAISQGYVEHIGFKYGVDASWLPTCLPVGFNVNLKNRAVCEAGDVRDLVFFGSINRLYNDVLREVIICLRDRWVHGVGFPRFRLNLVTLGDVTELVNLSQGVPCLKVTRGISKEVIQAAVNDAFAGFLPYSFLPSEKILVSTSFPTKLVECMGMQRPVVILAPVYSSTYTYAKKHNWSWCFERIDEFMSWLDSVSEDCVAREWKLQSDAIIATHGHSAIAEILAGMWTGQVADDDLVV